MPARIVEKCAEMVAMRKRGMTYGQIAQRFNCSKQNAQAVIMREEIKRLRHENSLLRNALHCISLASQDSGTTKENLGKEARAAIAEVTGGE